MKCIKGINVECNPEGQKTGICVCCEIWQITRYGEIKK